MPDQPAAMNKQASLFDDIQPPLSSKSYDLEGGTIEEYFAVFDGEEAIALMSALIANTRWEQRSLSIAGKQIPVPRLQCWMGDPGRRYSYSGMMLLPCPWSEAVLEIRRRIQQLLGIEFNTVLLNYYRDENDSVAWHADDEWELGGDPVIASVSLGAERIFALKPKPPGKLAGVQVASLKRAKPTKILLRNGSLIVMKNHLQSNWLHSIPKVKSNTGPRLNLTFRQILGDVK